MKIFRILILLAITALPAGCGQKDSAHDEFQAGASFEGGKGVIVREETRKIIGLEIMDTAEEIAPETVQVKVQVFTEMHRLDKLELDHSGCLFHGSGFLSEEKTALVKPKQPVKLKNRGGEMLDGFVVGTQKPLVRGESEIIVGITSGGNGLKDGEFIDAEISIPRAKPVILVPKSALLRTISGTFVYKVNGDAFYRTEVKTGSSTGKKIEIIDGLSAGDQVVVKPVETLWLIELRATKGGGHSH